ncbi:phage shock envelope stress response protein PspM [Rhodococcoides kyotonense]|uniref:Alanine rich transmembrane protein n=1 Tax=Rhodococcoides kyotonense TaxID=398843 RepID=A0A239D448_9NOCA|nr:hypothetical protein [Rhodococcus kyotonensis]SNS26383.1 hypothetical protein SAMN05421642_101339 [Rhodococcus kyotonensis]
MPVSESVNGVRAVADSARRMGESLVDKANRWNDPRQKHIRRTRRARRRGSWFGGASGVSVASTAGLAAASAPEWTMFATGGGAMLFAVPAVLALGRYRRLRAQPLPPARPGRATLPDSGSAAYAPMYRLAGAQRSLYELTGILARSESVDSAELAETTEVAAAAATALASMATDVVSMERAAASNTMAAEHLGPTIRNAADQLHSGVDQFEELVAAAARLTAPAQLPSSAVDLRRAELTSATDRLDGWATALTELAEIRRRHS